MKERILNKLEHWFLRFENRIQYRKKQRTLSRIKNIGKDSFLWGNNHVITGIENLIIGNNVHINDNCFIRAEGGVEIGDNTHISRNLLLYSINHDYKGNAIPYDADIIKKKVIIGKNVWIGMNVCISPGTIIGEGAIIGMGTVVSGEVPPHTIIGNQKWREIGKRDLEHYNYMEDHQKYGGISGRMYSPSNTTVLNRDNPKLLTKRGYIELSEKSNVITVRKHFDLLVPKSVSAFDSEKLAVENLSHYSWFPKSTIADNHIDYEYFYPDNRLDLIYNSLTKDQKENVKKQIIFLLIDLFKEGFYHRDLHKKNIFYINETIKIIDFETLIAVPSNHTFFDSYDITGKGVDSPYQTGNMCLFSTSSYSLNTIFEFESVEDFKLYLDEVMKEWMYDASNTFFTRKGKDDGRHTLRNRLIYNTFDLPFTKVNEKEGQRNISKRHNRFGINEEQLANKTILDLGSNIGGNLLGLNHYGIEEGLGLEFDKEKVHLSNSIAIINNIKNIDFKQCDLESSQFDELVEKPYDIVFCLAVIGHLKNPDKFINKLYTITKESLFIEGNANTTPENMKHLLQKAGFSKVEYIGLSDDELNESNNNRPLFIAFK